MKIANSSQSYVNQTLSRMGMAKKKEPKAPGASASSHPLMPQTDSRIKKSLKVVLGRGRENYPNRSR